VASPTDYPSGGSDKAAPTKAPTQTTPSTGKGAVAKTQATFQHPPAAGLASKPPSAATTGPKIGTPSVDYNKNQGNRAKLSLGGGQQFISGSQDQQIQDKGGS
jgi:hypothetical protein